MERKRTRGQELRQDRDEQEAKCSSVFILYCGVYTTSGGRMEAVAEELVIAFVASAFLIGIIHPPSYSSRQHYSSHLLALFPSASSKLDFVPMIYSFSFAIRMQQELVSPYWSLYI